MPRKKSPVTQPGIDPGTFRLVAQRLNHYATPGPPKEEEEQEEQEEEQQKEEQEQEQEEENPRRVKISAIDENTQSPAHTVKAHSVERAVVSGL
jgi:molybdopterin-biosynthesis enzyme MoeA-like protein